MIKHNLECNRERHDGQIEKADKWLTERQKYDVDWFTATAIFMACQGKKKSKKRKYYND